MLFRLIELASVGVAFYLIVTQLLIPGVNGTMLFPLFKKQQVLTNKLIEQNQEFVDQRLAKAIEENEKLLNSESPEVVAPTESDISVVTDKEIV